MDVKLSLEWLDQHSARHHRSRHSKVRVQKWRQRTFVCCYPWIWTYADEDSCGNEHGQPNRTWACWILSTFCHNQEGSRGIELETCILLITFLSNLFAGQCCTWHGMYSTPMTSVQVSITSTCSGPILALNFVLTLSVHEYFQNISR